MVFKRFFWKVLLTTLAITALWVGVVVHFDEFGLFRDVKNRELRIYGSERLSKYLFSYHYIPEKFNAVLIGPSLSDIIDTREFKSCRMYNLSITGGNSQELRALFENVAAKDENLKVLVICIDPYITRKTGMEEVEMTSKVFWNTLDPAFFISYNKEKNRALRGEMIPDLSLNTEWGRYHLLLFRPKTPQQMIEEFSATTEKRTEEFAIDNTAFAELEKIASIAREHKVRILAYYHPYPLKAFQPQEEAYRAYQRRINSIFQKSDVIHDFNDDKYRAFRTDYSNYLDTVHVSDKGAAYITSELDKLIAAWPKN